MVDPVRLELEAFCGRERSGSPQPKSRAQSRDRKLMVDPERLELPTSAFEAHCSIQLSYGSASQKYTSLISARRCDHGKKAH